MGRVKNKLNWQAYSAKERNEVIEAIKSSISKSDGYIINFAMYSDLALSLNLEIEEHKISDLHAQLNKVINISTPLPDSLNGNSKLEWWVLMNISFGKGKGDLKVEIPRVPG